MFGQHFVTYVARRLDDHEALLSVLGRSLASRSVQPCFQGSRTTTKLCSLSSDVLWHLDRFIRVCRARGRPRSSTLCPRTFSGISIGSAVFSGLADDHEALLSVLGRSLASRSVQPCLQGSRTTTKLCSQCSDVNTRSRRSSIAAVHRRRPCLSRGSGASVEQSARFRHGVNVAAHVQATPEDCTVREKLLNTGCFRRLEHLPSHFILFAFNFVRCPCSRSDIMPP